jgi:hypothetical protein
MRWKSHIRFGGRRRGNHRPKRPARRLAVDPTRRRRRCSSTGAALSRAPIASRRTAAGRPQQQSTATRPEYRVDSRASESLGSVAFRPAGLAARRTAHGASPAWVVLTAVPFAVGCSLASIHRFAVGGEAIAVGGEVNAFGSAVVSARRCSGGSRHPCSRACELNAGRPGSTAASRRRAEEGGGCQTAVGSARIRLSASMKLRCQGQRAGR